ncbi:hypothetical protein ACLBOM_32685 [Escherichia coli]
MKACVAACARWSAMVTVFTRRQRYALPERLDLVKGTVIGHRDGYRLSAG